MDEKAQEAIAEVQSAIHQALEQPLDVDTRANLEKAASELEKAVEQKEISAVQQSLDAAKNAINAAISSVTDPNAKRELEQALGSLSGLTVNSATDARQVNDVVNKAQQTAAGAEGADLMGKMGAALGAAAGGMAALAANPAIAAALGDFKSKIMGAETDHNALVSNVPSHGIAALMTDDKIQEKLTARLNSLNMG